MFFILPGSRCWCRPDFSCLEWFKRHSKYALVDGQETYEKHSGCNAGRRIPSSVH